MSNETALTYSSTMRYLNKYHKDKVDEFRKCFKEAFDSGYIEGIDEIENIALMQALKECEINYEDIL